MGSEEVVNSYTAVHPSIAASIRHESSITVVVWSECCVDGYSGGEQRLQCRQRRQHTAGGRGRCRFTYLRSSFSIVQLRAISKQLPASRVRLPASTQSILCIQRLSTVPRKRIQQL